MCYLIIAKMYISMLFIFFSFSPFLFFVNFFTNKINYRIQFIFLIALLLWLMSRCEEVWWIMCFTFKYPRLLQWFLKKKNDKKKKTKTKIVTKMLLINYNLFRILIFISLNYSLPFNIINFIIKWFTVQI